MDPIVYTICAHVICMCRCCLKEVLCYLCWIIASNYYYFFFFFYRLHPSILSSYSINRFQCSTSCGKGLRNRSIECIDSNTNKTVDIELCKSILPRPIIQHRCRHTPCPQWHSGKWSMVSDHNPDIRTFIIFIFLVFGNMWSRYTYTNCVLSSWTCKYSSW
jgi:hypothetical protein